MQGSSTPVSNSVSHIFCLYNMEAYNIPRHNVPNSKLLLQFDTPANDDCRFIRLYKSIADA